MEFYANGVLLAADVSLPYSYFWKPSTAGSFTLTAKAYDDDGAAATSAPVVVKVR